MQIRWIPWNDLRVEKQIRCTMGDIEELANLIQAGGWINPIYVTPGNVIIAGERRYRAIGLLRKREPTKWKEVPCIVWEGDAQDLNLRENLGRKDFSVYELGKYFSELRDRGLLLEQISKQSGLTVSSVSQYCYIYTKCSPTVLRYMAKGGHVQRDRLLRWAKLPHETQDKELKQWLTGDKPRLGSRRTRANQSRIAKLQRAVLEARERGADNPRVKVAEMVVAYLTGQTEQMPNLD